MTKQSAGFADALMIALAKGAVTGWSRDCAAGVRRKELKDVKYELRPADPGAGENRCNRRDT